MVYTGLLREVTFFPTRTRWVLPALKQVVALVFLLALFSVLTKTTSADESLSYQGISFNISNCKNSNSRFQTRIILPHEVGKLKHFTLTSPPRFVLDISNLLITRPFSYSIADINNLLRVRLGAYTSKTRLVFDLKDQTKETLKLLAAKNEILISFCEENFDKHDSKPDERKTLPGQLSLDTAELTFRQGERPVKNIRLENKGETLLELFAYTDETVLAKGGRVTKLTDKLFVSPKNIRLKPGEIKTIRILLANFSQLKERIFSVRFEPRHGKNEQQKQEDYQSVFPRLSITVNPVTPLPKLHYKRSNKELSLNNLGNVSIKLEEITQCIPPSKDCQSLPPLRLIPGEQTILKVPADASIEALKYSGNALQKFRLSPYSSAKISQEEQ